MNAFSSRSLWLQMLRCCQFGAPISPRRLLFWPNLSLCCSRIQGMQRKGDTRNCVVFIVVTLFRRMFFFYMFFKNYNLQKKKLNYSDSFIETCLKFDISASFKIKHFWQHNIAHCSNIHDRIEIFFFFVWKILFHQTQHLISNNTSILLLWKCE